MAVELGLDRRANGQTDALAIPGWARQRHLRARERQVPPQLERIKLPSEIGGVAAADDAMLQIERVQVPIYSAVPGLELGKEIAQASVDIPHLQVLHHVERAPCGSILEALEYDFVDVRGDCTGLG